MTQARTVQWKAVFAAGLQLLKSGAAESRVLLSDVAGNASWGLVEVNSIAASAVQTEKIAAETITAEKIKNQAVTGEKLAANSVLAEKIKAEVVSPVKTTHATKPTVGGENTVTAGEAGVARKIVAVIVGNNVETKFKIKHAFNTRSVSVEIANASASQPNEILFNPTAKVTAISNEEIEIVFTVAPKAKEEFWVTVIG